MASSQCDNCEMFFENDDELALHVQREHPQRKEKKNKKKS